MMQFIKRNLLKMALTAFLAVVPFLSLAAEGEVPAPADLGKLRNPLGPDGIDSIPRFIQVLLEGVLKIGIPLIALAIIYCGFLFVAAMGKPEKLTKAKNALLYTLIGAAILLGSWAIAQLISETVLAL